MKNSRFILFFAIIMALAGATAFAQSNTLAVSKTAPAVDGVINAGEYSFQRDLGKMQLSLNRTADTLYIGVTGDTTGWIAIGLGSQKMNGSTIFMGFLADGKAQFKPQMGKGHAHGDIDASAAIVSYAMKQADGKTTLEVALKAAAFIKDGQPNLDLIYAIGPAPNFAVYHTFRGAMRVDLAS